MTGGTTPLQSRAAAPQRQRVTGTLECGWSVQKGKCDFSGLGSCGTGVKRRNGLDGFSHMREPLPPTPTLGRPGNRGASGAPRGDREIDTDTL